MGAPWRGWRAPRRGTGWRGCTRASLRFSTRHTTTSTDRSALQVRLRALFVPSDRNRSPRGWLRAATMVGAARERRWRHSGGRRGSNRAPEVGRSDRRARIRAAHGHIIYIPGGGRARGGHGEGDNVSTCGVSSGFRAPRAKIGYPSMSLIIVSSRQTRGPPGSWIEVGPQGVLQTGIIIEVKRRLSGSFFRETRGLGSVVWG